MGRPYQRVVSGVQEKYQRAARSEWDAIAY